ncbi:MAG TPA: hypothetical protein VF337_12275 [Candidatus Limnocylindrales bacterium]
MNDAFSGFGSWPFVLNIWFLTAAAVAALLVFLRHSPVVRRFLPARDAAAAQGRFEQFWSRRDGRALAVIWIVLVALTIGDGGLVFSEQWAPVREFFAILQPVAGVLLVPMTAALYLYKRSVPHVASEEADEREREIQGGVYRRVHSILLGSLLLAAGLLVFNPAIGSMVAGRLSARGVEPLDVAVPAFLLLFMLPSVVYAWYLPHREDDAQDGRLSGPVAASGEAG